MFSSLIRKAEFEGQIYGALVYKNAFVMSHLFLVDDNIIFCRANEQEIDKVKEILWFYEEASGQVINFDKSEISFSGGVVDDI